LFQTHLGLAPILKAFVIRSTVSERSGRKEVGSRNSASREVFAVFLCSGPILEKGYTTSKRGRSVVRCICLDSVGDWVPFPLPDAPARRTNPRARQSRRDRRPSANCGVRDCGGSSSLGDELARQGLNW
jgi:hypothetical protein